jgi:tripartite-type tricarboxylate transporter receptor subunit TctC
LPGIPTVGETVPGYAASGWQGLGAPPGTPGEIIATLNREIAAALADPGMTARIADLGGTPLPGSAADFAKLIADDTAKWGQVVSRAGLKVE